jgi:hypothetical protein
MAAVRPPAAIEQATPTSPWQPTDEAVVIGDHRRDHTGGAVGRRGHDAAACGVLLVDRQRIEVDPVEDRKLVLERAFRPRDQVAIDARGAALYAEPTGQDPVLAAAAFDTALHRAPDRAQALARLVLAAPCLLVFEHDFGDRQAGALADSEQVFGRFEGMGQNNVGARLLSRPIGLVVAEHEPAADRIVDLFEQDRTGGVACREALAVGMLGQQVAEMEQQLRLLVKGHGVTAAKGEGATAANPVDQAGDTVGVDLVRGLAEQAEDDGGICRVAMAGHRQRAVEPDLDRTDGVKHVPRVEREQESVRRPHRADGMGTGGADPDFEQVENTERHVTSAFPAPLCRRFGPTRPSLSCPVPAAFILL